jgi:hypothetical protein
MTRASEMLEDLVNAFPQERVTVGDMLDRLEGRAFGLLLLLLAIPNCIPNIPGISTIFGVMLIAPAVQMIVGGGKPWLPKRVRAWSFQRAHVQMAIRGAVPVLRRIERYIRPSLPWATRAPFTTFLGLQTLFLAGVLILPIPFGNWPPGMTIAATALALLQKDGRLALLTIPMTLVSVVIAVLGFALGLAALQQAGEWVAGFLGWVF